MCRRAQKILTRFDIHRAQCSWVLVGISFLLLSAFPALRVCYGVTLEFKYWLTSSSILPIVGLSFVMAVFYKPKRTDAGYKRFLYFQFFTVVIVSEVSYAISNFRLGFTSKGLLALFLIPLWHLAFWLVLRLRKSAAKLPPNELSDFLCQTVLIKGTAAMVTMLFFSFETVSCFISQNSLDNGQCKNTSTAAMFLSVYLGVLTTISIVNKTMPKSVQRETAWELSSIASLKGFKWWQQIQGGLITFTAIVSLYLFSFLGVEGNEDSTLFIVGGTGAGSIIFAGLIVMTMLVRTRNEHQRNTTTESPTTQRSVRAISSGKVEEDMFVAALI